MALRVHRQQVCKYVYSRRMITRTDRLISFADLQREQGAPTIPPPIAPNQRPPGGDFGDFKLLSTTGVTGTAVEDGGEDPNLIGEPGNEGDSGDVGGDPGQTAQGGPPGDPRRGGTTVAIGESPMGRIMWRLVHDARGNNTEGLQAALTGWLGNHQQAMAWLTPVAELTPTLMNQFNRMIARLGNGVAPSADLLRRLFPTMPSELEFIDAVLHVDGPDEGEMDVDTEETILNMILFQYLPQAMRELAASAAKAAQEAAGNVAAAAATAAGVAARAGATAVDAAAGVAGAAARTTAAAAAQGARSAATAAGEIAGQAGAAIGRAAVVTGEVAANVAAEVGTAALEGVRRAAANATQLLADVPRGFTRVAGNVFRATGGIAVNLATNALMRAARTLQATAYAIEDGAIVLYDNRGVVLARFEAATNVLSAMARIIGSQLKKLTGDALTALQAAAATVAAPAPAPAPAPEPAPAAAMMVTTVAGAPAPDDDPDPDGEKMNGLNESIKSLLQKLGKKVRKVEDETPRNPNVAIIAAQYGNGSIPTMTPEYGRTLTALYKVALQRRELVNLRTAKGYKALIPADVLVDQKRAFTNEIKNGNKTKIYQYLRNGFGFANPEIGDNPSAASMAGQILTDLLMSKDMGGGSKYVSERNGTAKRPRHDSDDAKSISSVGTDVKVKRPRVERALLKA